MTPGGADANDTDRYSVRGQLGWDATEDLNLRLIAGTVQEDDKQSTSDVFFDPAGPLSRLVLPAFQRAGVSGSCTDNDPHNRVGCQREAAESMVDANELTLLGSYALGNGWTVNSISSWDTYRWEGTMDDVMQVMAPLLRYRDTQESESWQQELRLSSAGGETVDWLGGLFYYTNEFERGDGGDRAMFVGDTLSAHPAVAAVNQQLFRTPFPLPVATPGQLGYLDSTLDTDYVGVYGQATWQPHGGLLGDRWRALAAGGQGGGDPPVGEHPGAEPGLAVAGAGGGEHDG